MTRLRAAFLWVLPFLAVFTLTAVVGVCGYVLVEAVSASEEREEQARELRRIAESNHALLEAMKADEERSKRVVAEAIAQLNAANEAMFKQHDENSHLRHMRPPGTPGPIMAPPPRTTTATTAPRKRTTTTHPPQQSPPPNQPPATTCETKPNGKCKEKNK